MKIALVHDQLREYGGAERVVEAMHELWPEATLYTSFVDWDGLGIHTERFKLWDIRTSWVQNYWFVKKFISPLRFLAPKIWSSFDLSEYDVVLSSSGWFMCRGVNAGKRRVLRSSLFVNRQALDQHSDSNTSNNEPRITNNPLHICYIHHPPRNLYGYATGSTIEKYWPVRMYASIINFFLRHYDFDSAQRVDYFVANSKETARRVSKFYRRDSAVIYPPVEINYKSQISMTKQYQNSKLSSLSSKPYFLSVGRLTYSKQVDVIIEACNKLKLPLKIVGTGKEEVRLRSMAGQTIEFVGAVSDEELSRLYAGATALIFCALDEDFGIVPVEAMAAGVPVIALGQGGVRETVIDGKTGIVFDEPTAASLTKALQVFEKQKKNWAPACRAQAEKFSKERFQKELKEFVESHA